MPEDSDYYDEMAPNDSASPSQAGDSLMDERDERDEEDEGAETALLPKSIFNGKVPEPGESCTLTVVHSYEDEIEVQYSKTPEKEGPEIDKADQKLASMAE